MALGCDYVLLTGTHEPTPKVEHRLYGNRRLIDRFTFERLPGNYHGSGCTLASACAASLAHGLRTGQRRGAGDYATPGTRSSMATASAWDSWSPTASTAARKMNPSLRGLYAIADTQFLDDAQLVPAVEVAIAGGVRVVQYRDKRNRPRSG